VAVKLRPFSRSISGLVNLDFKFISSLISFSNKIQPDITMSEAPEAQTPQPSGVTEQSLKEKLLETLDATHVEITDVSGKPSSSSTRGNVIC
jgi:hypothetical protein